VPNARHDPRVKSGKWDGIKRLYDRRYKRIYKGLLFEVLKFAKKQGYSVDLDPALHLHDPIERNVLESVVNDFIMPHDNGQKLVPYEYQFDAVHHMLSSGRSICLAATSAGKSLMLYLAIRMYQLADDLEGKRIFVIVPSKSLVEQLYSDFENYAKQPEQKWFVSTFCQKVSGDYTKYIDRQIIISTWQSLKDIPASYLAGAGAIFVDETHTVNGPVLTKLLEGAIDCKIRHGLTGTLDGMECNELAAQGLLGPAKRIVTAKEIIDAGRATKVQVVVTVLDYDPETKLKYSANQMLVMKTTGKAQSGSALYQAEIEFINGLQSRINFIKKFVKGLKGNTIVLFDRVEGYGIPLYEAFKETHENTFLIVGDVKADEREKIRKSMEDLDDAVIFATSKIMSTGVNIKRLHNIVAASSNQSQIQSLQTIGRLMRLHSTKDGATIYDIVDKLDWKGNMNYTMKHVTARLQFYKNESHPVKFVSVGLDESLPTSITIK
jgi:superfamily II DNA or RNA helicase